MQKNELAQSRPLLTLGLALSLLTLATASCRGIEIGLGQAVGPSPVPSTTVVTAAPDSNSDGSDAPALSPSPTGTQPPVSTPTPVATDSDENEVTPSPLTADGAASPTPPPPTAAPTATALPEPVATLNPQGRVGLGIYTPETPYDEFRSIVQFERLVDHKMRYALWFHAWGDSDADFPSASIQLAYRLGFIPVLTWEPWKRDFENAAEPQPAYSLASIAGGAHDDYVRSWARGARAAGVPIVLRFAHEQSTEPGELLWYPWQGQPEDYKAAFRHIVKIFREERADNVEFLWSAMWLSGSAPQYYPGGDFVDLVGTTTLNHGTAPNVEWAAWRTFDELFSAQYEAALQWQKPIMITELATAEQGGDKAAWLRDCFTSLEQEYPEVVAVLLLEVSSDREWTSIDWTVASSDESLQAFKEAISNPYFK